MENTPLNPFDKLINFLKGNHTWTRIYKPNELTDPITKAIADNGKKFEDAFSKIASLKGEKGDPGKDAYIPVKGKDYVDGKNGKDGLPGKDGNDGKTPVKGKDYFDGKDGYTPKKGFDYFDGKDGVDGKNGKDGKTPVKGRDYFTKAELKSIEDSVSSKVTVGKQTSYSLFQRAIGVKNLDDVELSNPTNGQGLVYNATKHAWENGTVSGGGGGTVDSVVAGNNIDVDATDPANPIVSVETLTLADISDVTASATEVNYTDGVTSSIQSQFSGKLSLSGGTMTGGLVLVAGTTTIQPIKMVAGTNLTVPVAGVFEFDGTDLFFSV